jgi:hypothetical protein
MTGSRFASHLRLVAEDGRILGTEAPQVTNQDLDDLSEETLYRNSNFARIDVEEAIKLIKFSKEKKLEGRDTFTLFAMMSMTDWRDGKCKATVEGLVDLLGWHRTQVSKSVSRLVRAGVVVPVKEKITKRKIYLFNPRLLIYGTGKRRGYLIKKYIEAIHANTPTDVII